MMEYLVSALIGGGASVVVTAVIFGVAWKYVLYHPTPEEMIYIDRYYVCVDEAYRKSVR